MQCNEGDVLKRGQDSEHAIGQAAECGIVARNSWCIDPRKFGDVLMVNKRRIAIGSFQGNNVGRLSDMTNLSKTTASYCYALKKSVEGICGSLVSTQ